MNYFLAKDEGLLIKLAISNYLLEIAQLPSTWSLFKIWEFSKVYF